MPIPVKAVLFDYGNTLEMDPFEEILEKNRNAFCGLIAVRGLDYKDFIENWKTTNKKMNWQYASHFSQEEPFIQEALRKCGISESSRSELAPEILAAYRRQLAETRMRSPMRNTVNSVFRELKQKGKVIGIVSNDREWAPGACMKRYGAYELLDVIFTSEGVGIEKPDPKIFHHACDYIGVEPKELCYVGDDPVRDIQCPKQLGISAVLFVPPGKYKQSEDWRDYNAKISKRPDAVITDLRELPKLIE